VRDPSFLAPLLKNPEASWTIRNARTRQLLARHVEPAFDSTTRNRGLLGRTSLDDGAALILAPCSGIHTFFMRFPIDVVFVARDGRVVKVRRAMPAWRLAVAWKSFAVVELPAGAIEHTSTECGDLLELAAE
jgi:uncharacterized membrane protein (UPF0127 family)